MGKALTIYLHAASHYCYIINMYHNTKQQKHIQKLREKSTELLQQIYLRTDQKKMARF